MATSRPDLVDLKAQLRKVESRLRRTLTRQVREDVLANIPGKHYARLSKLVRVYAKGNIEDGFEINVRLISESPGRSGLIEKNDILAYEYGSGKHATGPGAVRARYPITAANGPRKGKFLAFHWEGANRNLRRKNFRFLPDGRVLLPGVMHPGVEPIMPGGFARTGARKAKEYIKKYTTAQIKGALITTSLGNEFPDRFD